MELLSGSGFQIGGTLAAGNAARRAAESEATQLNYLAQRATEEGTLAAAEERRKAELTMSRMLAVAGASGAGAMDPTVLTLMARATGEGELAAQTQLYHAGEEARTFRNRAATALYEGEAARRSSFLKAGSTILTSGKSPAGRTGYTEETVPRKFITERPF